MAETAELVARAHGGDHAAFAALYDRHARLVRAICFDSTGHLASAEDLSQEVFLKAYQKLHQLREGDRFVSWICAIARRAGRDWARRSRRSGTLSNETSSVDVAVIEHEPELAELRTAIRQLPDDERMALHLFYLDEQPVTVSRQVLGLSQSGFYKLLERARQHVGAIMRRN